MQPLLIVFALVLCVAAILAISFAIRSRKQADAVGHFVLGLSTAANNATVPVTVSAAAAAGAGKNSKLHAAKHKERAAILEANKVDEVIDRFILTN